MSGLDGIFILTIALLAYWGFKTGVIGTAIWLVAAYCTIALGSQIVSRIIPLLGLAENYVSIVTSFCYVLFSAAIFTIARWFSMSVRAFIKFTPLKWVNDIGGAVLGGVLGLFAVAAIIAAVAIFTYVIPEGAVDFGGASYSVSYSQIYLNDNPRSWLDEQLTNSLFVEAFSNLRGAIVPIAPREIGLAIEVLFARVE